VSVLINDTLYDYEGGLPKDQFIDRFNRHEMTFDEQGRILSAQKKVL